MSQYRGMHKKRKKVKRSRAKSTRTKQNKIESKRSEEAVTYLLESGTLDEMLKAKRVTEETIKYHWDYYCELARQRDVIIEAINEALSGASKPFKFDRWQRGVKYKYSLHPLCTNGSLTNNGGRFNTGINVNSQVPVFSALYLASDKNTALQEHLGQVPPSNEVKKMLSVSLGMTEEEINELKPRDLALCNPNSETVVSVSGRLDKVIDLRGCESLDVFVKLIKAFTLSEDLIKRAKALDINNPGVVKTATQLLMTLLQPDWTLLPTRYAVPANPQIFGHLLFLAGVEGVIYPSKFTDKPCLALFSRNFSEKSFIALDDEAPHNGVPKRIDATNWRLCELEAKEVIENS